MSNNGTLKNESGKSLYHKSIFFETGICRSFDQIFPLNKFFFEMVEELLNKGYANEVFF